MSDQKKDDGGPAFPVACTHATATRYCPRCSGGVTKDGLSVRDYFAAKAMQGMVGSIDSEANYQRLKSIAVRSGYKTVSEWIARDAYKQADAMLKARSTT